MTVPAVAPDGAVAVAPPDAAAKDDVWARVQFARSLRRPRTLEFMEAMADEFVELHGDRLFGDDAAVVAGLARIDGRRVVVIGQQKGADTDENIRRNFGMPHPEGYRKAMRVMELAERAGLPIVTFVDVPGAHPGPESEERGIAEAIARSIGLMSRLRTPIVTVITGEGGSGGALAIAVGDVVIALENAVYSVISPEGCASILWRTADEAATAAAAMRMSAADQHALGVVDIVVPEPGEGAHAEPEATADRLRAIILDRLDALDAMPIDTLVEQRYRRYRALGAYTEVVPSRGPRTRRPESGGSPARPARPGPPESRSASRCGRATTTRRLARRCSACLNRCRATPVPSAPTADRATDHAAIDRLTAELLPALIAKLGATGLGELEVREGDLARPPAPAGRHVGRQPGAACQRTATAERSSERSHERPPRAQHLHPHPESHASVRSDSRNVATSPAVGIFQPRKDLTAGSRVRAGDPLGAVDMLGVAQEVVAPIDGVVGTSLVEPGDAVEYGQELIIDRVRRPDVDQRHRERLMSRSD